LGFLQAGSTAFLYSNRQCSLTRSIVVTRHLSYVKALPSDLAATDGQYCLVMRKGKLYLYDFNKDPLEKVNLLEQSG